MAGEGTVMIGNGRPDDDEINQLLPPEPLDNNEDLHEDLPDTGGDDERRTTEDDEIDAASTEAEREKIRARRKQERIDKRVRQRERFSSLEREVKDKNTQINQLNARLSLIEKQNLTTNIAQLKTAEDQAEQALEQLRVAKINATNAKDGPAMLEAEKRMEAIQKHRETLTAARIQVEANSKKTPPKQQPTAVVENAMAFRKRNPWFADATQPNHDQDSAIVSAIDSTLLKQGWDPATPAYWQELETRARKVLPDKFKNSSAQGNGSPDNSPQGASGSSPRRQTVVGGSGGATGATTGGRQSQLTADRVQAIKDVGKWDDPALRAKAIKAYQDYDKANPR